MVSFITLPSQVHIYSEHLVQAQRNSRHEQMLFE